MGRRKGLGLSVIAALMLAACGGSATSPGVPGATDTEPTASPNGTASPAPASGGTLRVGMGGITATLDPQIDTVANGMHYYMAVFDGLTYIDGESEVQPALATEWTTVDELTWDFTLREDVVFSNGNPFTADDVVFSIERILDPETESAVSGRIPTVEAVEAIDATTVRFSTSAPDPLLPRRLSVVFIVDAEYFDEVGEEGFAQDPIGTGPFAVTDYVIDDHLNLEAVETSWRGRPSLDAVEMIAIPEISTRVSALRNGEIDVVQNLSADQAEPLQADGFEVVAGLAGQTCMVNLNNRYDPPLSDERVRLALNHAVDKQAIVDSILAGYAVVAQGQLVGTDGFGHHPDLEPFPYDPDRARSLLEEAGYPDGFSMRLVGTQGFYPSDVEVVQAVVGYFAEVGVTAEVEIQESATYVDNIFSGQHTDGLFHCLNYFPAMDADFILTLYQTDVPMAWYTNPEFDEVFAESRQTLDSDDRLALLHEAAELLHESPPGVFLYQNPVLFGVAPDVDGVEARPDLVMWFDSISKRD